jgi:glycosyltransferase involved in cell wall biosynthesis
MRILLLIDGPYLPYSVGGAERTAEALCHALLEAGHAVALLPLLPVVKRRLLRRRPDPRLAPQHPCLTPQGGAAGLARCLAAWRPDRLLLVATRNDQFQRVLEAAPAGVAAAAYLMSDLPPEAALSGASVRFAASRWLADRCRVAGLAGVRFLPPLVTPARYAVHSTRQVATVAGTTALKGIDRVLALAAALPEIPFRVYRTWGSEPADLAYRARRLPNLELLPPEPDFRRALAGSRVVLVPSRQETWGRVVAEAQVSGIPALASAVGGLPECVGGGGCLLPAAAPLEAWAAPLRRCWRDEAFYAGLAAGALAMAARPERQPAAVVGRLLAGLGIPLPAAA